MANTKILKFNDLVKYYNKDGTLKNGINKVYIGQSHPFIFVKKKEEYINELKAWGFNVIDIIGLYAETWMRGTHCIYFTSV